MQRHRIRRPRKNTLSCYAKRERALKQIGFDSYKEYLNSHVWKTVRELAFEKHGRNCVKCGKLATSIHHSLYEVEVLLGVELDALHPVCHDCHQDAERTPKGDKTTTPHANRCLGVDKEAQGVKKRCKKEKRKKASKFKLAEKTLAQKLPRSKYPKLRYFKASNRLKHIYQTGRRKIWIGTVLIEHGIFYFSSVGNCVKMQPVDAADKIADLYERAELQLNNNACSVHSGRAPTGKVN